MRMLQPIEGFLIQTILYLLLWFWDEYAASLISIVFVAITFFILIVSFIAELIERSKVPRSYFIWMIITILAPLFAAIIYIGIMGGQLDWLEK